MHFLTGQSSTRPIYGCPLDEHLQSTGKEIALVIEACVSVLYHEGLEEEGLFRIAGSAGKLKKLKVTVAFCNFRAIAGIALCVWKVLVCSGTWQDNSYLAFRSTNSSLVERGRRRERGRGRNSITHFNLNLRIDRSKSPRRL